MEAGHNTMPKPLTGPLLLQLLPWHVETTSCSSLMWGDLSSVFLLSFILSVCTFGPCLLGDSIMAHGAWAGENLTEWNHTENLPSVLTPKLSYQAKLLCKGCSSLRKSYFQFLL